jgi:hypothetical protein
MRQLGIHRDIGAGMTHPEVLRRAGLDPEVYQSFAGMGIERYRCCVMESMISVCSMRDSDFCDNFNIKRVRIRVD